MKLNAPVLTFFVLLLLTPILIGQTISVVTEEFRPFNYWEDGDVRGMSTEIVKECLRRAEISYSINVFTWQRSYTEALNNANVLIYTITRTKEREDKFHWIGQIAKSDITFYRLKSRPEIQVNSLQDLKRYMIATPKNDAVHEKLIELGHPQEKLMITYGDKEHLTHLLNRTIDLLPANRFGMVDRFRDGRFKGASFSDLEVAYSLPVADEGLHLAFSKTTAPELVEKLRATFKQVEKEGLVKKVIDQYFMENSKMVAP